MFSDRNEYQIKGRIQWTSLGKRAITGGAMVLVKKSCGIVNGGGFVSSQILTRRSKQKQLEEFDQNITKYMDLGNRDLS